METWLLNSGKWKKHVDVECYHHYYCSCKFYLGGSFFIFPIVDYVVVSQSFVLLIKKSTHEHKYVTVNLSKKIPFWVISCDQPCILGKQHA